MQIETATNNLDLVISQVKLGRNEHIQLQANIQFLSNKAKEAEILQTKITDLETLLKAEQEKNKEE